MPTVTEIKKMIEKNPYLKPSDCSGYKGLPQKQQSEICIFQGRLRNMPLPDAYRMLGIKNPETCFPEILRLVTKELTLPEINALSRVLPQYNFNQILEVMDCFTKQNLDSDARQRILCHVKFPGNTLATKYLKQQRTNSR